MDLEYFPEMGLL